MEEKALIIMKEDFCGFGKGQAMIATVYRSGSEYKHKIIPREYAEIIAYKEPEKVKPIRTAMDVLKQIKRQLRL